MNTTWIVESVHATVGTTRATLKRVEWFKTNPDYTARMADPAPLEDEMPDEFIDALPGEEGAEYIEVNNDHFTIEVNDFPVSPGENVIVSFALATVPAHA